MFLIFVFHQTKRDVDFFVSAIKFSNNCGVNHLSSCDVDWLNYIHKFLCYILLSLYSISDFVFSFLFHNNFN